MMSEFLRKSISTVTLSVGLISLNLQSVRADDRRDFNIYNGNSQSITQLYISSPKKNVWGPDILSGVLTSGNSTRVYFNNNSPRCVYDVKAVYSDGTYDVGRFNLCKTNSVNYAGNGGDYSR